MTAGSLAGEADENTVFLVASDNGEVTGDHDEGIEVDAAAGSPVDEADDNTIEIAIDGNEEIGGNEGKYM